MGDRAIDTLPDPTAPSRGWHSAAVVVTAAATHLAIAVAPLISGRFDGIGWVGWVGWVDRIHETPLGLTWWLWFGTVPFLIMVGMVARSRIALLIGAPASWGFSAYFRPEQPGPVWFAPSEAVVALGSFACYVITVLWWLRARSNGTPERCGPDRIDWIELERPSPDAPWRRLSANTVGLCAAVIVALPGAGVLLWPEIGRRIETSYPTIPGLVGVGLVWIGTLFGLALGAQLTRPGGNRAPSRTRVVVWLVAAGALWALGQVAGQ